MTENERQLQQEREKLNRLVDEALQNGSLTNKAVLAQSYKVDRLVVKVEMENKEEG